jgi:hypothetical protein
MPEEDTFLALQMYAQDIADTRETGTAQTQEQLTATFEQAVGFFGAWTLEQLMSLMDATFAVLLEGSRGRPCESNRCPHWLTERMQWHMNWLATVTGGKE